MSRCLSKDIIEAVANNVSDAGVCVTNADGISQALAAIDLAQTAIMKRIDSEGALWEWHVPTYDGCFALPEDCESDRQIFVNGFTATPRDQWYEGKLSWGQNYCGTCCPRLECVDLGEFSIPIPFPKVHGVRVALVADSDGDAGTECTIEVVDPYGNRQRETLSLLPDREPVLSASMAYDVTFFRKPQTLGAVKLQLHYDNGQRMYHARYGPKVMFGRFRRKRLPQRFCGCNMIAIKGKLRAYRVTSQDDILPFEDRPAWIWGVTAVAAMKQRDVAAYNSYLTLAINELKRDLQNSDPPANFSQAVFTSGFGCNPSLASGRLRTWN